MKFSELNLAEPLLRAVESQGYHTPTKIQAAAIGPILEGRDLLGCAQTGTGKTAAFTLPTLDRLSRRPSHVNGRGRKIRALVLAPTRELALQIDESIALYGKHSGLRHTVIYGGVGQNPQTRSLNAGVDILVATPGRLLDLMQQGFVDLGKVEVLILDEADRMLDMGFLPDLKRIVERVPRTRQTLLFSATMAPEIRKVAAAWLTDPVDVQVTPVASTAAQIEQSVIYVPKQQKLKLLTHWLKSSDWTRALVFTRTKHGADKIAKGLARAGIATDAIHGNKAQTARQRALARFKSNEQMVLVATDIAARGLDIDEVSHVINFELPHEAESYVHRIGRTGRAGATGIAVSFCAGDERADLRAIERLTRQTLAVQQPPAGMALDNSQDEIIETDSRKRPARRPAANGTAANRPRRSGGGNGGNRGARGARSGQTAGSAAGGKKRTYRRGEAAAQHVGQAAGAVAAGSAAGTQQPRAQRAGSAVAAKPPAAAQGSKPKSRGRYRSAL